LIWLTFDPQAGREQAGRRPALVLSPAAYNEKASLALVCPISSRVKGYPFEVHLPEGLAISGVVLSDHLKSLDWTQRKAEFVARVPSEVISEVLARLTPLLGF
jgi:mRNA interferase MazF